LASDMTADTNTTCAHSHTGLFSLGFGQKFGFANFHAF